MARGGSSREAAQISKLVLPRAQALAFQTPYLRICQKQKELAVVLQKLEEVLALQVLQT